MGGLVDSQSIGLPTCVLIDFGCVLIRQFLVKKRGLFGGATEVLQSGPLTS